MTRTEVKKVQITQIKSGIATKRNHRETLRSLGLKRIGDSVVRDLDEVTSGMIRTVAHLITVEEAS